MLPPGEIDGAGHLSFLYVMTRQILFLALLLLSSAYAFIKGGQPERIGAATLLGGASLTVFVASPFGIRFQGVEAGIEGGGWIQDGFGVHGVSPGSGGRSEFEVDTHDHRAAHHQGGA